MGNVKSVKLTAGLRNLRPSDFKAGTILISNGFQSVCGPDSDIPQDSDFYMTVSGKYPLVNLKAGEQVHYSVADELKLTVPAPGSSLRIEISSDKIHLRLRNKYVKGPKHGNTNQV